MSALLEMSRVAAAYARGPRVLEGIDLQVESGEILGVLGMNGAGKSTLIRTIDGELPHVAGSIRVRDVEYRSQPPSARARKGIVTLPEGHRVIQPLTVHENLELSTLHVGRRAVRKVLDEHLPFIYEMFPILKERKDQLAGLLSGGEQQMLSLSRALMADPRLLLLDEPSLGLAPAVVGRIYEVLPALAERGIAVLIVEQSPLRLQRVCRRLIVLREGRVAAELGSSELNDDVLRDAYFGQPS